MGLELLKDFLFPFWNGFLFCPFLIAVAVFLELETANACHFYGILQHFGLCSMLQLEAAILRNLLDCGLFQVGGCIYMYL